MSFSQVGTIIEKFDEQQVSEKFRKREFVIEVAGQYPEQIKFQLVQDKCTLVEPYHINDEVKVTFTLRGRGFNKNGQMMYFTNLEAWKIEPTGNTPVRALAPQQQAAPRPAQQSAPQQPGAARPVADDDNDLPF